jgi:hypothetical protein
VVDTHFQDPFADASGVPGIPVFRAANASDGIGIPETVQSG